MVRNLEEKAILVRNLASEVLNQCSSENVPVFFNLCAYLIDLKILQWSGIRAHEDLAETLIEACVNYLKEDSLSLKTIKLQINWEEKYQTRDEIKRIHHERIFKNILPIMSEITENSAIDKEHFYKKIVIFAIMFAGLGCPTQQSIIQETQAALLSIFKCSEIENFMNLPKATKEQQLMEFARLITGIMLFNKDCKKGGEGMDDLPLILTQGVRATKERLLSFKDQLVKRIDHLVKGLAQGYCLKQKSDCVEDENKIPESTIFRNGNLKNFKTLLTYYNQLKYFTNDIIKDLENSFEIVKELVERLQITLLKLHKVVRYRVAVATVQVFPLFVHLSDIWVEMQEEVDIISEINNNFVELSFAAKLVTANLSTPLELDLTYSENPIFFENEKIQDLPDFYPGVKVCSFSSSAMLEHFQYKGFCAWTLADMEGFLVPGNVEIGVLEFSNRIYTFSSAEAASKWAVDPTHCIKTVLKITQTQPELVKFLNLYTDLKTKFLENLTLKESEKLLKANAFVQTDLHPIESHMNRDYTFSEWELKKRAMKLANLTRYVTRSQQTVNKSCFRNEVAIQATPHRSTSTQTVRDRCC